MRQAASGIERVVTLGRAPVSPELDAVVVLGGSKHLPDRWWDASSRLGIFLQSRDETVYRIAVAEGSRDHECYLIVERISATDVVVQCAPEKGDLRSVVKFVFDPRAKALAGRVDYDVVPFQHVIRTDTGAVFRGPEPFAIAYSEAGFRVLKADPLAAPKIEPKPLLPSTTWDDFAAARPGRVKDGYVREGTQIEEQIGPRQTHNGVLWFGKTFYDGEGHTGVGGFGYFDGTYHIFSPPEIADWSVTTILVEDDAVWLGLANHGEWGTTAGGLLRFDRATETMRRIDLPDVVNDIARDGDRLLLATNFGLAIFENESVRRFFLDKTTDGRLRVAEATRVK